MQLPAQTAGTRMIARFIALFPLLNILQLINRANNAQPYALCFDVSPFEKKSSAITGRFERSLFAVVVDHERGTAPDVEVGDHRYSSGHA